MVISPPHVVLEGGGDAEIALIKEGYTLRIRNERIDTVKTEIDPSHLALNSEGARQRESRILGHIKRIRHGIKMHRNEKDMTDIELGIAIYDKFR